MAAADRVTPETGKRIAPILAVTRRRALARQVGQDLPRGDRVAGGVAIGMVSAFRFSRDLGLCSGQDATRVEAHLKAVGLPTRMGDIPSFNATAEDVLAAMRQDKKVDRGRLTFILARGIGESFVARDVDEASVSAFLAREMAVWT